MTIKGFITNLGKYNEGELVGEWITFPIDDDDLQDVLKRIGINEYYEETFFTDWECDVDLGFGEYENIEHINDICEELEYIDEDMLKAAIELWGLNEVSKMDSNDLHFLPDVNDDYGLGYYWIEQSGCYDVSNFPLKNYIDYEGFGRDVRLEENGGFVSGGYIYYVG